VAVVRVRARECNCVCRRLSALSYTRCNAWARRRKGAQARKRRKMEVGRLDGASSCSHCSIFALCPRQRSHNMKVRRYARPIPAALLACWPVHFSLQSHGWEGGTGRAGTADAPDCAADQRAAAVTSFARLLASSRPLTAHTHPSLPHSSTSRTRPPGARKSWKSMTTRNCEWSEKRERGAHFFFGSREDRRSPPFLLHPPLLTQPRLLRPPLSR